MSLFSGIFRQKESPVAAIEERLKVANPQEYIESIIQTLPAAAIVIHQDLTIVASNSAADSVFGRFTDTLKTKRLTEIIRDLSTHQAFHNAIEKNEITNFRLELPVKIPRVFDARISPLHIENEQYAIGIFQEMTEFERLERMRQEFLSDISHELRTPLTAILAFLEMLEDGAIEDESNNRRFLSVIRKNSVRMQTLIDDISELSLIEAGQIAINKRPVDLANMIDEIFTNLSGKAAEKNVALINLVKPPASIFADQIRLEQMLTNLIDNAIKFNCERGSVTVAFDEGETRKAIKVIDEGEGIAAEHHSRIFERFYRTDKARSREIGGTGLGLAIVKHLARLHDGNVTVTSELTKGATFMIDFPNIES